MDGEHGKVVSLKALVDKEKNRVVFAESEEDFVDILFSFLTKPIGTIIRINQNQPPKVEIGCMNNLYRSVENLDVKRFQTEACKTMLLNPQNVAAAQCKGLKLNIDDGEPLRHFCCRSISCTASKYKLLSHYRTAICGCGEPMDCEKVLHVKEIRRMVLNAGDEGVFVKGLTRFILSDELQVKPLSAAAGISLFPKLGVGDMDPSTIEEKTFDIDADGVLHLLKCSLVSNTPLTEALLKQNPVPEIKEEFNQQSIIKPNEEEEASKGNRKICVKLIVSKSKKIVCYAEAGEDFIDLLFSFLIVPLGKVGKEMHGESFRGCINYLYKSVQDLDAEKYLKSVGHKAMLVNPKFPPGFSYENHPLQIEEDGHKPYYYAYWWESYNRNYIDVDFLTSDRTLVPTDHKNLTDAAVLTVIDPKSHYKKAASGGGFVIGPTMFIVTDDLIITPISFISGLSILNKLKVPFSDIEELVVRVGNEEASRLLVSSLVSESALTNTFILTEPTQE